MPRHGGSAARGYGSRHRAQRKRLLDYLQDGEPCAFCNEPMTRDQELDADHSRMLMHGGNHLPDRLAHAVCNRRAGITARWARDRARRGHGQAKVLPLNTSRDW